MSAVLTAQEPSAKYLVNLQPPLVRHFDLIAQAPGGVARLRELILTLAVQGKLVPQDPSDEPASELLKKIRAEKDRLIAEGKIKRDKPLAEIADEEKPFELPQGWERVRLGDVQSFTNGFAFKSTSFADEGVGVVRIGNVHHGEITEKGMVCLPFELSEKVDHQFFIAPNDLVITMTGDVKLGFNKSSNRYLLNQRVGKITPILVDPSYLVFCLELVAEKKIEEASGSVIPNVSTGEINATPFALPPLAEQSRIVTRVEELMQLCDALEASGQLEAQQHAQLVGTLLSTLTQSETHEALANNWQRIATHFDLLLDRPEAVDALEQTILQLAVRGLLVPQDPRDEPAKVLLRRVTASASARSTKAPKTVLASAEDSAPYELPDGWEWCRLGEIVENMGSGWSPACDEGERSDPMRWAVLRTTAVQTNEYRYREHKALPPKLAPRPEIEVKDGDILITRAGPMNRVGISCWVDNTPHRLMLSDKIVRFHSVADEMVPAFIVLALNAGWTKDQIEKAKTGMAASQVNISQADLRALWLPVCSKAEQSRIVTRVNELRILCSELRQRLIAAQSTHGHLADALVAV